MIYYFDFSINGISCDILYYEMSNQLTTAGWLRFVRKLRFFVPLWRLWVNIVVFVGNIICRKIFAKSQLHGGCSLNPPLTHSRLAGARAASRLHLCILLVFSAWLFSTCGTINWPIQHLSLFRWVETTDQSSFQNNHQRSKGRSDEMVQ